MNTLKYKRKINKVNNKFKKTRKGGQRNNNWDSDSDSDSDNDSIWEPFHYVKQNYGKSINTHTYDKDDLQFTYNATTNTLTIKNIKKKFSQSPFEIIELSKNETFEQKYKNQINKALQLKKTHEEIFNQIMKLKKIVDKERRHTVQTFKPRILQPPKGGKSRKTRKIRKKYTKNKKNKSTYKSYKSYKSVN